MLAYMREPMRLMLELPGQMPRLMLELIWLMPAQMPLYTPVLRRRTLEPLVPKPPYMPVPISPAPAPALVSTRPAT